MSRRAVIVSPEPGANVGGVERYCWLVRQLLTEQGWEVTEVGPQGSPGRVANRLRLGDLLISRATTAPIAALRPDLVVSNGMLGAGAPRSVPRIHVYHGTMVDHTLKGDDDQPRSAQLQRIAGAALAEWAAGARATNIATTPSVAAEVRRYYRRRVDRIIPLTVDTERFAPRDRAQARERLGIPDGPPLALFVGSLEHRKGDDLLQPVCERAGWRLAVTRDEGPAGAICLGRVSDEDLPWAYAACDALLFPSRYEGFGYITLEALACGRPVVATPTGWAPTLVERVPEYAPLVVPTDVDALAGALRHVADAPEIDTLVERARAVVLHEHGLDLWRAAWAELVDDCMARGGTARG